MLAGQGFHSSGALATTSEAAVAAATEMGFPVAMKILSGDIQHKSDIGGVVLNVSDAEAAAAAFETIMANVRRNKPEAAIDGVLVASMAPRVLRQSLASCAIRSSGRSSCSVWGRAGGGAEGCHFQPCPVR